MRDKKLFELIQEEEIRQTEEFLGWDFNADEIRFFETYLKGLEQLKEDMEWNFGDN